MLYYCSDIPNDSKDFDIFPHDVVKYYVNTTNLPLWELVEVSFGLKIGYKLYALRLRGIWMLPINKHANIDLGIQIRGPVMAIYVDNSKSSSTRVEECEN